MRCKGVSCLLLFLNVARRRTVLVAKEKVIVKKETNEQQKKEEKSCQQRVLSTKRSVDNGRRTSVAVFSRYHRYGHMGQQLA
jgi:hypothetical protein